jgi:two-component system OmpR family sensor kinase
MASEIPATRVDIVRTATKSRRAVVPGAPTVDNSALRTRELDELDAATTTVDESASSAQPSANEPIAGGEHPAPPRPSRRRRSRPIQRCRYALRAARRRLQGARPPPVSGGRRVPWPAPKSLRGQLTVAFLAMMLLGIATAGSGIWMIETLRQQAERTRLAQDVLAEYLRLTSNVYQLFKQLADGQLIGGKNDPDLQRRIEGEIDRNFVALRTLISREVKFVGPEEIDELQDMAGIERALRDILEDYRKIQSMRDAGQRTRALANLVPLLEERIDQSFNALVRKAIAHEQEEVAEAIAHLSWSEARFRTAAWVLLITATLLGILFALMLSRSVARPLAALSEGTRALAAGVLDHRVEPRGAREFTDLAASFNSMAKELEVASLARLEASQRLEQAVEERTRELASVNLSLERANASLERIDGVRRRFLADISHEIRTPLTVIRGEAEITLRGGPKDVDEYRAALQRVVEQSTLTTRLVDDLLFVARKDAGDSRLDLKPVDFCDLVSKACEDARALGHVKEIEIEWSPPSLRIMVPGDPKRLRQLLLILLDNAVRYSLPRSSVQVELTAADDRCSVRVSDRGIGIAEADLANVFERYYRGSNATAWTRDGTGLGLPMAKAIVEAHNGTISIESKPEQGTVVIAVLPISPRLKIVA